MRQILAPITGLAFHLMGFTINGSYMPTGLHISSDSHIPSGFHCAGDSYASHGFNFIVDSYLVDGVQFWIDSNHKLRFQTFNDSYPVYGFQ